MGYSYHVPLRSGTLKIKSESRLRGRERDREVPVWKFAGVYFVWQPKQSTAPQPARTPPS